MRFAGALSILALGAGSAAFGQDAANKDGSKDPKVDELQRQVNAIQAQLDAIRGQKSDPSAAVPVADPKLDGAIRQSPLEPATDPRRLNISAPGIEGIDLYGGLAMRGNYWANFNEGAGPNDVVSAGTEAWLGAKAKINESDYARFTLHYAGIWGNNTFNGLDTGTSNRLDGTPAGTPTSNSTNNSSVAVTEASIFLKDIYKTNIDVTAGRQRVEFGAERILGDDEWRLNRTVFDGLRFDQVLGPDLGHWTLVALRLTDNDNIAPVNGSTELAPTDGNKVDNTNLYGLYYTLVNNNVGAFDVYIFQLEDMNFGATSGAAVGRTRLTTYGGRWKSPSFAGFTGEAEGATQFGEIFGSDTHNYGFGTYAMHLEAGWSPEKENRIEYFRGAHVGYDYATGGSTLSDNFVQLYPTLHGWFGLTDLFGWSNIEHYTIGADFDCPNSTDGVFSVNYHWDRMAKRSGGFAGYNASGVGSAGTDKSLGQEFDLVYSRKCTDTLRVSTGLGYFFDGKGFRQMEGSGNDMLFVYVGFRLTF